MSCCANLANVQRACATGRGTARGLGGTFDVACVDGVAAIPAISANHTVSDNITMETDEIFYNIAIDHTPGQNSWKVEAQGEGQSKYYVTTVEGFIPGIAPEVTGPTDGMLTGEYICIIRDKNGHQRIVGEKNNGCIISVGEQNDTKNGCPVVITWESAHKPYYYTGTIPN